VVGWSQLQESYEIGSEANADQPNVWLPEPVLPGFRAFCSDVFYAACHRAALRILRALALGLGLSDTEAEQRLLQLHTGVNNQLRLLHYPAVAAEELESGAAARMPAHSDWR
jgi:isopenicillin N synthase-like dioxygenase